MSKRSEIRYFAQEDLWNRGAVSEQLAVAEDLIRMVPDSVKSILDAGCGNGTVTNQLAPHWDVVGCDISEAAVSHVNAPALVADLCAIPFADECFDLTLSSDVIEHLPDAIYAKALAEIARVSGRYILIAVPYRELLAAAEINCPGCGLHYHAHLHQRSYTVADAVSLFSPAFTAVDVRFSGEFWAFEDPRLVEAAHEMSGLDYPFEDGVCPDCFTRRGHVEQSNSALKVQRRFEALQAMLVAEGERRIPDPSEILVLFERGASPDKSWTIPESVSRFNESTLQLASLALFDNPINYPRAPLRIKGDPAYAIVTLPRRPESVQITVGNLETLEVYDHVRRRYVNCTVGEQGGSFLLAQVPFGPHGCILRMFHPTEDLQLQLSFSTIDKQAIIDCSLGDDPTIDQMREDSSRLSNLAEQLEATRADLESKLQKKEQELTEQSQMFASVNALANDLESKRAYIESQFALLSERAASQEELINVSMQRIDAFSHEKQLLNAQREALQTELNRVVEQLATQSQQNQKLNSLANHLERRREELEEQLHVREQQLGSLQEVYDAALLSVDRLTERAQSFELKQHEFVCAIEVLDSQVSQAHIVMLERRNEIEQIDALELEKKSLQLELKSLHLEASARSHELIEKSLAAQCLNELSNRLEEQREVLEAKVKSLVQMTNSLANEKSEYQTLLDAFHIHLGLTVSNDVGRPRKVLILSHMYPREYNLVGGIFVHEQAKALRAQGIDARVVSGEPFWINTVNPRNIGRALTIYKAQKVSGWEEYEGVPLIRFPYIVSSLLPFQTHAATYTHGLLRYAKWLYSDFPFELIHAHTAYTDGTAGSRLAKKYNVPLVITEHTGPFTTLTRTRYLRRTTQKALNAADKVISVSEALLSDILQQIRLKSDSNTQVIANLVDTEFFSEQLVRSDGLIHLLWVGHFVPVKRVPVLLEAFAAAYKVQPNLRLRLAGSGEGREHAEALVENLGIGPAVEFVGHANRTQLVNYYSESDFLVISSESETFGVVAIEAMSCGRPVLTTRCGGPSEIVSHVQLGQVVGMSVEELSKGILSMAQRRTSFNSKVIRKVTELRFSSSSIAREIASVYSTLIGKSAR
ncbi:glycosyltransferase [Pseudomonas cichorii]|nr:glycosyltransferase [Pseudomonas cichorii]